MDAGKTGAYLAALRKARGMTQQEAADQLGVSNKTVSKWGKTARGAGYHRPPALAELYGVTADDILAGETLRGRPAEAQGPARRRLLLLLRTRFDLCFIGDLALGVLAAFRVAYVSLAAWPLSVGLLWIGYVLAVHPARYGDISLDAKIWENLYRSRWPPPPSSGGPFAAGAAGQAGGGLCGDAVLRHHASLEACSSPWGWRRCAPCWSGPCAAGRGADASLLWIPGGCGQCSTGRRLPAADPAALAGGWRGRYFWRGCGSWRTASWTGCWRPGSPDMGKSWSKAVSRRAGPSCGGGWRRMWHSGSGCGRVLIAGAVSRAGVLVLDVATLEKAPPPLAEEGET